MNTLFHGRELVPGVPLPKIEFSEAPQALDASLPAPDSLRRFHQDHGVFNAINVGRGFRLLPQSEMSYHFDRQAPLESARAQQNCPFGVDGAGTVLFVDKADTQVSSWDPGYARLSKPEIVASCFENYLLALIEEWMSLPIDGPKTTPSR